MSYFKKIESDSTGITTKDRVITVVKNALDMVDLNYDYNDKETIFKTSFMGDDLRIPLDILIDDECLIYRGNLALKAACENYREVTWKLNEINAQLKYGSFFLKEDTGFIHYEYGFPYRETMLSSDFFLSFLRMVVRTIDAHDGNLKRIAEKPVNAP